MAFLMIFVCYGAMILLLTGVVAWVVIGGIKELGQDNKTAGRRAAWAAGALALALCLGLFSHFLPYSRFSARLFYHRHAKLLNTVAEAVLDTPRQDWSEHIPGELEKIENLSCRRGVSASPLQANLGGYPSVEFCIYIGSGTDSGDGSMAYPVQDLVYCPEITREAGEYHRSSGDYCYQIAEHL